MENEAVKNLEEETLEEVSGGGGIRQEMVGANGFGMDKAEIRTQMEQPGIGMKAAQAGVVVDQTGGGLKQTGGGLKQTGGGLKQTGVGTEATDSAFL